MTPYEQGVADGQQKAALAILDHADNWRTDDPRTPAARIWDKAFTVAARVAEAGQAPAGPIEGDT